MECFKLLCVGTLFDRTTLPKTTTTEVHNENRNLNLKNQCIFWLTISFFQGSQPCCLVWEGHQQHVELQQQLQQHFTEENVKSSQPLGGTWTPDIYDHGSKSIWVHWSMVYVFKQSMIYFLVRTVPRQLIIETWHHKSHHATPWWPV